VLPLGIVTSRHLQTVTKLWFYIHIGLMVCHWYTLPLPAYSGTPLFFWGHMSPWGWGWGLGLGVDSSGVPQKRATFGLRGGVTWLLAVSPRHSFFVLFCCGFTLVPLSLRAWAQRASVAGCAIALRQV